MNNIKKQRFLAELSRLLTFMYEEDRQEALAMYSSMFDEAVDEEKLIQLLMSPTRQAVVVARAYDAKERKLQVTTQSREDAGYEEGKTPDFAVAIEKVRAEAETKGLLRGEDFEVPEPLFEEEEAPAGETAEEPVEPSEAEKEFDKAFSPDGEPDIEVEIEEIPETDGTPAEEAASEETSAEEDAAKEAPAAEEADAPAESEDAPEAVAEAVMPAEAPAEEFDYKRDILEEEEYPEPEKKAMVGWLTLFVFFAIPVGFVCCVALVALALVFLALAAAVVMGGVFAVKSLFSSFSILADILLVGGAAIGVFALGLLFLWTAVWCLFGAIPGLIRGLIELGRSWCYKEVAAE